MEAVSALCRDSPDSYPQVMRSSTLTEYIRLVHLHSHVPGHEDVIEDLYWRNFTVLLASQYLQHLPH